MRKVILMHVVYVLVSFALYWYTIFGRFGTLQYQMGVSMAAFFLCVLVMFSITESFPYVPKA